jgi:predicted transcriptional regulator
MCKILISINPEHVKNIIDGIKKYEYRTRVAKRDVDSIIVYCTYPTKKVLAEVKIKSVLADTPNALWERTKDFSGISKEFFMKYFNDRETAYAYELGEVLEYNIPKDLIDFGCISAPQSYMYVNI